MDTPANIPISKFIAPLLGGGFAGLAVDVSLYPLDTLKTRLQSEQGFQKAGGFRGMYRGILPVTALAVPCASLFFVTYETTKSVFLPLVPPQYATLVHMGAASLGEVIACVLRVPLEIVKQRKQTYAGKRSSLSILLEAYRLEGVRRGVYRGFLSTVARDLPFSFIELPVWELLKSYVRSYNDGQITSLQSAACGSLAGGLAATLTTPLDLAKTRIMLASADTATPHKISPVLHAIYNEAGVRGLFAGATPRLAAFMLGGFVYFGAYDHIKSYVENRLQPS